MVGRMWRWVDMLTILLTRQLLFSAPTCALCRSSSAPTRSTSPTASSGTRERSAANPREYLELPETASRWGGCPRCARAAVAAGQGPAFWSHEDACANMSGDCVLGSGVFCRLANFVFHF